MSRLVAFAAIQGAYNIVQKAEGKLKEALEKYGPEQKIALMMQSNRTKSKPENKSPM